MDKSDDFARTFVESGTFGFIPGDPSAYTQPLYGFFLVPLYWIFERHWLVVGLAQIRVAVGRAARLRDRARVRLPAAGVVAALVATLHPYLVWHDVHMNREILDQLLAAAAVLTLVAASAAALARLALGAVPGWRSSATRGSLFVPLVLGGVRASALGRAWAGAGGRRVAAAALVVAPWVVRNEVEVGCVALTTDARALEGEQRAHLEMLARGGGSTTCPIPGRRTTPQEAGALYRRPGAIVRTSTSARRCASTASARSTSGATTPARRRSSRHARAHALGPAP